MHQPCGFVGYYGRVIMRPQNLKELLRDQPRRVKMVHDRDTAGGYGRVAMPYPLARKYPNAATEWRWRRVFPQ